jgi:hypothetical protein
MSASIKQLMITHYCRLYVILSLLKAYFLTTLIFIYVSSQPSLIPKFLFCSCIYLQPISMYSPVGVVTYGPEGQDLIPGE